MLEKLSGWDDTIVALATPPGVSAIGVIRLTGNQSIRIVGAMFPSKDLLKQDSHTIHVGHLRDGQTALDEVVVMMYKAPGTYTGEDIVEISCHGSPYIHEQVILSCIRHGARVAKPGEFTQRAFLHGKLDLTQAEAVGDLISGNTSAAHKNALHNMRGGFSQDLKILREQLIRFSALIELELDFSQEDVEFADRAHLYDVVSGAEQKVTSLLDSFRLGNVIRNGVQVAIVGKPNSGKSTLLNTLLNENRAIVSDIAGTTRDTIEEVLNINGIMFRLVDTAGIREHTSGSIESLGIEKTFEKIRESDIVIYLFDALQTSENELQATASKFQLEGAKFILAGNKSDTGQLDVIKNRFKNVYGIVFISAKENLHIDLLKERIVSVVLEGKVSSGETIITNTRHYDALMRINRALKDIRKGLDDQIPADLIALDIRLCLQFLGEITGEITTEDQLDYIFSKFCIGK